MIFTLGKLFVWFVCDDIFLIIMYTMYNMWKYDKKNSSCESFDSRHFSSFSPLLSRYRLSRFRGDHRVRESTNPWPISKLRRWRGMLVDPQSRQLSSWRTQKTCHRPSDVRHWSIDRGILETYHPSVASRHLELIRDLWNRI